MLVLNSQHGSTRGSGRGSRGHAGRRLMAPELGGENVKTKLGPVPLLYPIPIVLVGADVDGKPGFCTVGDVAIMGIRPALVCASLSRDHHTTGGIAASGVFSINLPTAEMLSLVDACGMVSGRDCAKAGLFTIGRGDVLGVPLIIECPVNLECEVIHEFAVEHRRMFIARVAEAYIDEARLRFPDGDQTVPQARYPLLNSLDPIIYSLDNSYYRIGERIGRAYEAGREIAAALVAGPTGSR